MVMFLEKVLDNLMKKFTHEYDRKPICKAPYNPLELHDTKIVVDL